MEGFCCDLVTGSLGGFRDRNRKCGRRRQRMLPTRNTFVIHRYGVSSLSRRSDAYIMIAFGIAHGPAVMENLQ